MSFRDRIRELRRVPASQLVPNPKNFRDHPEEQRRALRGVLSEVGVADASLARELPDGRLMLIDGHLRQEEIGADGLIPVLVLDVNEREADILLATLDPMAAMAKTNHERLDALLADIGESINSLDLALLAAMRQQQTAAAAPEPTAATQQAAGENSVPLPPPKKLADRFVVPPFSVLDARQGYWQERKREWLALGIQSEVGRGENLLKFSDTVRLPTSDERRARMQGMNSHSPTITRNPDGTLNYGTPLGSPARTAAVDITQPGEHETASQSIGTEQQPPTIDGET